jgi:hypothetical protein
MVAFKFAGEPQPEDVIKSVYQQSLEKGPNNHKEKY